MVTSLRKSGFLQQTLAFVIMALNSSREYGDTTLTFYEHPRMFPLYAKNGYSFFYRTKESPWQRKPWHLSRKGLSSLDIVMTCYILFRIYYFIFNFVHMCVLGAGYVHLGSCLDWRHLSFWDWSQSCQSQTAVNCQTSDLGFFPRVVRDAELSLCPMIFFWLKTCCNLNFRWYSN